MNQNSNTFFATYIRKARTHLNLTRGELAALWGQSEALVSDIENDIRSIEKRDILSLSRALGLPVSELLEAAASYVPTQESLS